MAKIEKRGLGRGLSALISPSAVVLHTEGSAAREVKPDISTSPALPPEGLIAPSGAVRFIPMKSINNNPSQPRQHFLETELNELAESIKTLGILQPILVRARGDLFEIVAGERRWRAAQRAGLAEIPAMVRDVSELELLQIALVENIQREQLNPIEEAHAYDRLMREFKLTQDQVADAVGKNRASISNYLRLLKLAPEVLKLLQEGRITMGHAKAILTVREPAAQVNLARKVVEEGLSVRSVEAIVARVVIIEAKKQARKDGDGKAKQPSLYPEIVDQLRNALGTRVTIKKGNEHRGKIEIEYFSEEELDRLVDTICGS